MKFGKLLVGSVIALSVSIFGFNVGYADASTSEINLYQAKVQTEDGNEIGFKRTDSQEKFNEEVNDHTITQEIMIDPLSSTLEIPLDFQNGEYMVLGEDDKGESDGASSIYNKNGESIAILSSPIIEDENITISSVQVENGDTLTLNFDSNELDKPAKMQISLMVASYSDYFSSGVWIVRDGMWSLSLTHKPFLMSGSTNEQALKLSDSWTRLSSLHSVDPRWTNSNGLRDQYACHYNTIGGFKNPWNLEPARPDVGYTKTVLARCNP